jgi:hypothetical protein
MSFIGDDLANHTGVTAGKGFISLTNTLWRRRFKLEALHCVIRNVLCHANGDL